MPWTVPFDDLLCERSKAWTLCGRHLTPHGQADIWWGCLTVGTVTVDCWLCSTCSRSADPLAQVQALLERRYQGWADGRCEGATTTRGFRDDMR